MILEGTVRTSLRVVVVTSGLMVSATTAQAQAIDFIRQFGSSTDEIAFGVARDDTGVYVVGFTSGTLPGQQSAGARDAFVRKYDRCGAETWTRQFGTPADDFALGVAASGSAVYVVGFTGGLFSGNPPAAGGFDAFLRKYSAEGNEAWTRQFGSSGSDRASSVALDATDVYVVGRTLGVLPGQSSAGGYLRKYGQLSAAEAWTESWSSGGPLESREWVAVNTSGVYVTGRSSQGDDVSVEKMYFNGNQLCQTFFGTSNVQEVGGVAADSTGIYVVGGVQGALPLQTGAGGEDAFVKKFATDPPIELWTQQFGTSLDDVAEGVAATPEGFVYVVGHTFGTLQGQFNAGLSDAFVRTYSTGGYSPWTQQFGSPRVDRALGTAADAHGVYVVGYTEGALPGQAALGATDAFLARLHSGPAFIELTKSTVENLGRLGRLNSGQVSSLTVKLDAAAEKLTQGEPRVARNNVQAFANEVDDLTDEGVLSREESGQLSSQVGAILGALICF